MERKKAVIKIIFTGIYKKGERVCTCGSNEVAIRCTAGNPYCG